jgi:hypothetical protein
MKNEMKMKTDCKSCREHMADLLLDERFASAHPETAGHVASCAECGKELSELKATFALMDHWTAPEPSPYFDSKLRARLREAAAAEPEGFWERMRSFLMFSTGRRLRPALAGALALVMVAGGGSLFLGVYPPTQPTVAASPTVNDLKMLDNNAQALQQMDQLLDSNDDSADPPSS